MKWSKRSPKGLGDGKYSIHSCSKFKRWREKETNFWDCHFKRSSGFAIGSDPVSRHRVWNLLKERKSEREGVYIQWKAEVCRLLSFPEEEKGDWLPFKAQPLLLEDAGNVGPDTCDLDSITSLVKQYTPDAKLSAQSEEKLVYILPLEKTNKFPDLYRDLYRSSNLGIENYDVSMTTLHEVFLKLEGKSVMDESDIGIWRQLQSNRPQGTESLVELEELKHEKKSLLAILLLFSISFLPQFLDHLFCELYQKSYAWGLTPDMYFLSQSQPPQVPLTHLLVINKTGLSIDHFMHSLRRQDVALEVDALGTRNGPNEPSYNGAITVSRGDKEHMSYKPGSLSIISFWTPVAACFAPYIAMSSIGDSKWFGQALVDIPLCFFTFLLMQIMDYIFIPDDIMLIIQSLLVQISPDSLEYLGTSEDQLVFLALLIPYLHFFIFLLFYDVWKGTLGRNQWEKTLCSEFLQEAVMFFQTQKNLKERKKMLSFISRVGVHQQDEPVET
ncbi:hypothetical protein MC885_014418 [Smutsia gigantea]|nr:hypothetical protein MC885_014418 [Smutsia gigantea]